MCNCSTGTGDVPIWEALLHSSGEKQLLIWIPVAVSPRPSLIITAWIHYVGRFSFPFTLHACSIQNSAITISPRNQGTSECILPGHVDVSRAQPKKSSLLLASQSIWCSEWKQGAFMLSSYIGWHLVKSPTRDPKPAGAAF